MQYSAKELLELYKTQDLSILAELASVERERLNGSNVFYNQNFHLEPSNICAHKCLFCSYRRDSEEQQGAWTMNLNQIKEYIQEKYYKGVTEVHIVGSVNPHRDFKYYQEVVKTVRTTLPSEVFIRAYSAVEIADMCISAGITFSDGLKQLQDVGLGGITGGGAEIFNPKIRTQICPDKIDAQAWLNVHKEAHKLGIQSNSTMLFGHIESYEDRIEHLLMLRELQDETGGFNSFIPLKYRNINNILGTNLKEVDNIEVLKTFAISRLALNNILHIKSYWPMLGKELCQQSLLFGADDVDGTINDSTKIYSMAGAEEQKPQLTINELNHMVKQAGYKAVERDSYYNILP